MPTISEAFAAAVQLHQAGRLSEAEQLYRQILAVEPDHAGIWHLLGVLALQAGQHEAALQSISRAIELNGAESAFHCNLGNVFQAQGKLDNAVACFRRAIELQPHYAVAQFNLATALHAQGKVDEAIGSYLRALAIKPDYVAACYNLGCVLQGQNKLDEAIEYFFRTLQLEPQHAQAHNNLGNALQAQGNLSESAAFFCRALELNPNLAEAHNNLGSVYHSQGKLNEAVACFRRALQGKPDYAEALSNLGNALKALGILGEAVICCRRALELNPNLPEAHSNLASALLAQDKPDQAVASCLRALDLKPDLLEAHSNLGNAFRIQVKLDEAVACCRRALELNPNFPEAHSNLGNALRDQGKLDEAVACCRRALELKPDYAEAHSNLGIALQDQGKLDEAIACFRRALELKPDIPEVHSNLGTARHEQGKLDEAAACFRRALELKPDYFEAHNNLGTVLNDQGQLDDALPCFRRALELKPDFAVAFSNLLLTLQYRPGVNLPELATAHAGYEQQLAAPLRSSWRPHENDRDSQRRLRLGFVSTDFGRHPVGFFLIRALENLDRERCETVCYSNRPVKDELTTRFQAAATIWRDTVGWSNQQLADQIRADRIDMLFDLAGHTAKNRLLVFARKPAPIQITWAGYVGTTGLAAINDILADRFHIPPHAAAHYCEHVLRMPDGYVCYDPPAYAPDVSSLPALQRGSVTFGSFNNRAKINPLVVQVWAKILDRVPQSRLVLKCRGMDDASIANPLTREFARHGIDPARVECLGWSPHGALLAEYNRIDLALDPFPYNGGLTTCEALWMGVPVITCPGETFASRHSLSHLSNVGLTETVAHNLDDYVERAVMLASDLSRLADMRSGLRGRVAASPLCDGKRFAENLMQVLRERWRRWCQQART